MTTSNEEPDFSKLSSFICGHLDEHEGNITKLSMQANVVSVTEFYKGYDCEMKKLESQFISEKRKLNFQAFAEIYKSFDEYPANLQKPETQFLKTANEQNTTSENINEDAPIKDDDIMMSVEYTSTTKALNDFRKFRQKLQLLDELEMQEINSEYASKMCELQSFVAEMEDVLPIDLSTTLAFSSDEEDKLCRLAQHTEELDFIQAHQQFLNEHTQNNDADLNSIVDLLTYTLMSIENDP
ncbi:uncharacterized protein LOC119689013 [Teleopsis dalmanni]|uniref:uncharacterized protein LOC119689013 n=1 Tax=Teleopsis dalmanni TaxID=139649 RepID=UPI000D32C7BB|nr:uncharacterized protein LOC119689013 [Teleopsis dalmanni]